MRAQVQIALGSILTITIVTATLILGMWGLSALAQSSQERAYDRVYDELSSIAMNYRSYGSREIRSIAAPEPFCIVDTNFRGDCGTDVRYGSAICESMNLDAFFKIASENDGNVRFASGTNRRIESVAPYGNYTCFSERATLYIEGRGTSVVIAAFDWTQ